MIEDKRAREIAREECKDYADRLELRVLPDINEPGIVKICSYDPKCILWTNHKWTEEYESESELRADVRNGLKELAARCLEPVKS